MYWNEIDWIKASLKQIEKLDPLEVVICDGCFDPKVPNHSTDGTREIIKEWVSKRRNAKMISAVRYPKFIGCIQLLKRFKFTNFIRLSIALFSLRKSVYRVNQALTFNHMIHISKYWKVGRWFMTMDGDQFYSDEMIERFKKIINKQSDIGLLIGKELTFFKDFGNYTEDYDKRGYNNMPHKIYVNTFIKPTRELIKEYMFRSSYYKDDVPTKFVGQYFHYKFRPKMPERVKAGYALGDRKPPSKIESYKFREFTGKHPSVIEKLL